MSLQPLKRVTATGEVHAAIRDAILTNTFHPGERLVVEELAAKLGVSLTPVRTAIQLLTAEGLIETRPRSGTFVATLSSRDIEETFDIRLGLELVALEKTVTLLGAEELERLNALLKILAEAGRHEDGRQQHDESNQELHRILVNASQNKRLMEMYESLDAHIQIARIHATREEWRERLVEEEREHAEIVRCLAARDLKGVLKAMRIHIEGAKNALVTQLSAASKYENVLRKRFLKQR